MRSLKNRPRTLTLNLSEDEMAMLEEWAVREGLNKSAVLRQAIRRAVEAWKREQRVTTGKG
jgi:hypothetical protein